MTSPLRLPGTEGNAVLLDVGFGFGRKDQRVTAVILT